MIKILALTLLSTLAAAQAPCTGFKCSASTAQFTVLGEITAVDQTTPPNTASNYTARMDIKCAYASFTNPPSRLISANQNVLVKDFGTFEGKCGNILRSIYFQRLIEQAVEVLMPRSAIKRFISCMSTPRSKAPKPRLMPSMTSGKAFDYSQDFSY